MLSRSVWMAGDSRVMRNLGWGVTAALWCLVSVSIVALVIPIFPLMPERDLDPSWAFAMNQSVAQGLGIGSDVLFTFGPYASVFTQVFHPQTDYLMLLGATLFAVALGAAFRVFRARERWPFALAWVGFLLGAVSMPDTLFFAYIFVAGVSVLRFAEPTGEGSAPWRHAELALVMLPFGLLPLIKGSFLVLALPVCMLAAGLLLVNRRYLAAVVALLVPLVSLPAFWLISGQPLAGLSDYFVSMKGTVSGYSEAMALDGNPSEIIYFLIGALLLLLAICFGAKTAIVGRAYLFLLTAGYLFVVFKAGFVRHDFHALTAGASLLAAALAINLIGPNWKTLLGLGAAFAVWLHIDGHYFGPTAPKFSSEMRRHFVALGDGVRVRAAGGEELDRMYRAQLRNLAQQSGLPRLEGTTDIYSFGQSSLFASGNIWNPRPVFQSYAAYTPEAAETNRQHLLGDAAPDNIFFTVQPIDYRFPSTEDGPSWPVLLERYMPVSQAGAALVLKRMDGFVSPPSRVLGEGRYRFGEWVDLPSTERLLFAQFDIRPTILGRLAGQAFKPSQLKIEVVLENGMRRAYRLVSGMARSPFLLSPLVDNTRDFSLLYGAVHQLSRKRIRRFMVSPTESQWMWHPEYEFRLSLRGSAQ